MDGTGWVSHGLPTSVFGDARDLQARLAPFVRELNTHWHRSWKSRKGDLAEAKGRWAGLLPQPGAPAAPATGIPTQPSKH